MSTLGRKFNLTSILISRVVSTHPFSLRWYYSFNRKRENSSFWECWVTKLEKEINDEPFRKEEDTSAFAAEH